MGVREIQTLSPMMGGSVHVAKCEECGEERALNFNLIPDVPIEAALLMCGWAVGSFQIVCPECMAKREAKT